MQDGKGRGRKRDSSDDEDFSEYQDLMKKNKFKKYYSDSDRVGTLLYSVSDPEKNITDPDSGSYLKIISRIRILLEIILYCFTEVYF